MKYFRTPHLPFSEGCSSDDKKLVSIDHFLDKPLVFTEKLDGSNVCLTRADLFARSHSGPPTHPSFDPLKARHAELKYLIEEDISLFCEWTYAQHSLQYNLLADYLNLISIRDDTYGRYLDWNITKEYANELKIPTVPIIAENMVFDSEKKFQEFCDLIISDKRSVYGPEKEGFVVRIMDKFYEPETSIAKYVRKNHVQTDDHWSHSEIKRNLVKHPQEYFYRKGKLHNLYWYTLA